MLLADILKSDPDFLKKLPHYKTAFAPTYNRHVGLVEISYDDRGEPIIHGRMCITDESLTLFRVEELTDFVL